MAIQQEKNYPSTKRYKNRSQNTPPISGFPGSAKSQCGMAMPFRRSPLKTLGGGYASDKKAPFLTRLRRSRDTGTYFVPERGVAAASADGVVLSPGSVPSQYGMPPRPHPAKRHIATPFMAWSKSPTDRQPVSTGFIPTGSSRRKYGHVF